jgi:ATP-dependent DNA helicase RecQ
MSRSEWRNLMEGLIDIRMVRRDPNESEKISVTEKGRLWLKNRETLQLPVRRPDAMGRHAEGEAIAPSGDLWQRLRGVRKRIADELDIAPHAIFDDRVLWQIERRKPRTIPGLLQIEGMTATKAYRYGRAFISEIERYQGREFSGGGRADWNSNRSRRRVPPSAYQTLELHMNGMTIDEIARARRVTRATIAEHLQLLEDLGEISDMHFREGGTTAPASSITGDAPDGAGRRPGNRGKPWKPNDDMLLRQKFSEGLGIPELAAAFMRTEGAIHSRLMRLGLIEE